MDMIMRANVAYKLKKMVKEAMDEIKPTYPTGREYDMSCEYIPDPGCGVQDKTVYGYLESASDNLSKQERGELIIGIEYAVDDLVEASARLECLIPCMNRRDDIKRASETFEYIETMLRFVNHLKVLDDRAECTVAHMRVVYYKMEE